LNGYSHRLVWQTASILSIIGLVAALSGVGLISFGLVDYFRKHRPESDEANPRAAWVDAWAKVGYALLVFGIAISVLTFAVRLMGSD
jgi:uncharacterized membrane protein YidH (DUF202 family)